MDIRNYTAPDFMGNDTKEIVVEKVQQILDNIHDKGIIYANNKFVIGYAHHEVFDWDLYFETVFLSYFGIHKYGKNAVELFLDTQHPSGFIARTLGTVWPTPRHQFKPFLAQTALLCAKQSKDFRWLSITRD